MPESLSQLRDELIAGIKQTMQRSYHRRAPATGSVVHLIRIRDRLMGYVEEIPTSTEAWELLSRAEECLMNYQQAIDCLQNAISHSGKRDKRMLKRLALLRESMSEWSDLPITPQQLRSLGEHLIQHGANEEKNGRSLKFTREWLEAKQFANVDEVLEALSNRGGYTDFQILYNVVRG